MSSGTGRQCWSSTNARRHTAGFDTGSARLRSERRCPSRQGDDHRRGRWSEKCCSRRWGGADASGLLAHRRRFECVFPACEPLPAHDLPVPHRPELPGAHVVCTRLCLPPPRDVTDASTCSPASANSFTSTLGSSNSFHHCSRNRRYSSRPRYTPPAPGITPVASTRIPVRQRRPCPRDRLG
jgi:hypothetical protein